MDIKIRKEEENDRIQIYKVDRLSFQQENEGKINLNMMTNMNK